MTVAIEIHVHLLNFKPILNIELMQYTKFLDFNEITS
jgi:hypothetical protein